MGGHRDPVPAAGCACPDDRGGIAGGGEEDKLKEKPQQELLVKISDSNLTISTCL
jgi:hypothetical protein